MYFVYYAQKVNSVVALEAYANLESFAAWNLQCHILLIYAFNNAIKTTPRNGSSLLTREASTKHEPPCIEYLNSRRLAIHNVSYIYCVYSINT